MTEFYIMTANPNILEEDKGGKSHIRAVVVKGIASFVPHLYKALGIDERKAGTAFVVDDTPMVGKLVEGAMVRKGWKVHGYDNPAEALKNYQGIKPEVVISDYQMHPHMTGLEMTRKMSELDGN